MTTHCGFTCIAREGHASTPSGFTCMARETVVSVHVKLTLNSRDPAKISRDPGHLPTLQALFLTSSELHLFMNFTPLTHNKAIIRLLLKFTSQNVVKPSVKAFLFAYLYITLPKIINNVMISVKNRDFKQLVNRTLNILTKAFHPLKFPMFSASLIAIINVLEPLIARFLQGKRGFRNPLKTLFVSTFISSFIAASAAFPGFQKHILGYGRFTSLDLTLLMFSRALDTTLSSSLSMVLPLMVQPFGDALLFIGSCSFIMYSWFFHPDRLPPAYRKWITSAANMDEEIVQVLRNLHFGDDKYGEESQTLTGYCARYGKDPKIGDLKYVQPVPCELVHAFVTPNCELHALWRFKRGFEFAFRLYGGLNLLMLLVPKKIPMILRLRKAFMLTIRSSSFLGAYIGLYWYAVCLARKRLLPKLFPKVPATRWDSTIAPTAGAIACGFSGFVETAQRRKELALFVLPRAIGTLVPTELSEKNIFIERLVFALSMATLMAYCKRDPTKVRGIFGKGLKAVMSM